MNYWWIERFISAGDLNPSEAFRFLYSILCADKFTYWSQAIPPCQLLVRRLEEDTEVRGDGSWEEEYALTVITEREKMTSVKPAERRKKMYFLPCVIFN